MTAGAYIMNLTHFFNEKGEIPVDLIRSARELAHFLALIVDNVTAANPGTNPIVETEIRCRKRKCQGTIIGVFEGKEEPIHWFCEECGHYGYIYGWQQSKWDNTVKKAEN